MDRIIEIYTGAYASGKSEIAINRAIQLQKKLGQVTLVDMDTVEPAYTLRPIQKTIEKHGFKVVTQEDYFGLGETGNTITATQQNCLSLDGNIVIDVGYGAGGLDALEVVNNIDKEPNLKINIVINTSKFETSNVDNIIEYVEFSKGLNPKDWKVLTGIISNTHFSDETTYEDVIRGYEITKKASEKLNIPILGIGIDPKLLTDSTLTSYDGVDFWKLERFMPKAMW